MSLEAMALLILVGTLGAGALALPRHWTATLLLLCAFIPASPGGLPGISQVSLVEVLPAIFAAPMLIDMLQSRRPVLPRRQGWVLLVIGLFALGAFVNGLAHWDGFTANPRAFWILLMGLLLVFEVSWYARWLVVDLHRMKLVLAIMVAVAAIVALARLGNYYLGTPMPWLTADFQYGGEWQSASGEVSVRIGGLTEAALLGASSLAALAYAGLASGWVTLGLAYFASMTILAGGRTFAVALSAATLTYVMLALRGRRVRVAIGTALALLVALAVIQAVGQTGQYSRLTSFAGGLRLQDPNRNAAMTAQLVQFIQHPLLGKGLGVLPTGNYTAYVAQQLQYGGHSTYTSALANFGLVGGAFVAAVVLTPLVIAVSILRSGSRRQYGSSVKAALAFVLITGVVNSLVFLTGGNGYSDMSQYAILGLALACVSSGGPTLDQDIAKGGMN